MTSTLALDRPATIDVRAGIVVLVGPLPPPSGGMANQTLQLARLLDGEGIVVRHVQTNAVYRPAWVGRIRGVRAIARLGPYVVDLWRAMRGADVVHVMANSGWAWHLFAAPAVWIAAWRNVPAVVNYRGGMAASFLASQVRCVRPTLRRARQLIVPSGFLQDVFAQHRIASTIVPNIVDLDAFHPAPELPREPHLLVTRNLEAIYDIGTAIRAFVRVRARYPAATLTVAGSGPERAPLEALAGSLGVHDAVRFTGRLDNARLPELYRTASVVLNPSTVDNTPISLLEALASGVPVVSTNVGGVPYLVQDGETALLVPPRNPEAMADAVCSVLDDAARAGALRAAGVQLAARHAWPQVRPLLVDVYERTSGKPIARVRERASGT